MPFHGRAGANRKVVFWPRVGSDANGQPVVDSLGIEMEVRWDLTRREVQMPDGALVGLDATAGGLTRSIPVGSACYRGSLADLSGTSGVQRSEVYRVVTLESDDDWRARDQYVEVGLSKASDALPPQAEPGT